MNHPNMQAMVEALLFTAAEPKSILELAMALDATEAEVKAALADLRAACAGEDRGLQVVEIGDGLQLMTKPECARQIQVLADVPEPEPLSRSALETLAIIAYRQPVTRAEIEDIRGVRAARVIGVLLERDLIVETGRREGPGRPILYGTTRLFLDHFGLQDLQQLPPLDAS